MDTDFLFLIELYSASQIIRAFLQSLNETLEDLFFFIEFKNTSNSILKDSEYLSRKKFK